MRASSGRATLIIMVKAPVAGRVKTRLGADIGLARSAAIFRSLTRHTIMRARRGPWRTVLAVDPVTEIGRPRPLWPASLPRVSQGAGDLGARMKTAMRAVGPGPVVIIGADAPAISAIHVRAAFERLRGHDAVFGPADDGGYWLIGLARRTPAHDLFAGVRWSSATTLDDTLRSLPPGFRVSLIETLSDIDTADDLAGMQLLTTRD